MSNQRKSAFNFFAFIRKYRWHFTAILWLAGFWLGYTGFSRYANQTGETYHWLDKIYLIIQLAIFESGGISKPPLALNIARFLLPFLTAQTSLMALATLFSKEFRRFTLRFSRGHVVVCGDGRLAFRAVQALLKGQKKVVWVTKSESLQEIQAIEELGGVVLQGNLSTPDLAGRIALDKAGTLFSFYDDDHENIENSLLVEQILTGQRGRKSHNTLQCITHLHDPLLSNLFLEQTLKAEWKESIQHDVINVYQLAASLVAQKFPPFLRGKNLDSNSILVIGFGKFGQHVLLEIARQLVGSTMRLPVNVHVMDREADWKTVSFTKLYPELLAFFSITPHELEIYSPEFQDVDRFLSHCSPNLHTVYICLDDDATAVHTALLLYRHLKELSPQIVLRLMQSTAVRDLFEYGEVMDRIQGVSFYDEISTPQVLMNSSVELLAKEFHKHYLEQTTAEGKHSPSAVEWETLSEEKKESNRRLVRYLKRHLQALGYQLMPMQNLKAPVFAFSPEEIDTLARNEHERWCEDMCQKGYRYGLENNPARKTNPYLRQWKELSDEEKRFNCELMQIIPQMAARAGLQIVNVKRPAG